MRIGHYNKEKKEREIESERVQHRQHEKTHQLGGRRVSEIHQKVVAHQGGGQRQ